MTFPQWRTQSRLYRALRMPADNTSVTTVAHRCGWSSTSAFIDVIRRSFRLHPRNPQPPSLTYVRPSDRQARELEGSANSRYTRSF